MTLRLRLVLALVVLVAVGLAVFGVATYAAYRAEHERLDDQLRASQPFVTGQLYAQTAPPDGDDSGSGGDGNGYGEPGSGGPPGGRPVVPSGTYAELREPDGAVLATIQPWDSTSGPALPDDATASGDPTLLSTGSTERLRAVAGLDHPVGLPRRQHGRRGRPDGRARRLAAPSGADRRRRRRSSCSSPSPRGVARATARPPPLEHMATSARSITAGDLSQRVEPADNHSEVGQLGLALNTMLGEIEVAFQEREATEQRLRQFLADASHELRTPLTSIQGFAELFRVGARSHRSTWRSSSAASRRSRPA